MTENVIKTGSRFKILRGLSGVLTHVWLEKQGEVYVPFVRFKLADGQEEMQNQMERIDFNDWLEKGFLVLDKAKN